MCVEECRWDFLALDYEGDNPAEFLILIEVSRFTLLSAPYFLRSTD